ncbi:AbgT family transporter [Tyzzerella sp. OttesenSCG-928-J15]|nr:AbgT family transporter [Tyzzerella sp. OttesenSCG-928-J15]
MADPSKEKGKGVLGAIERVGNALPHPNYIFMILFVAVIIISGLCSNITFLHPGTGEEQVIKSLLGVDGLKWFFNKMVDNFIRFRPLGLVLVTSMGIGLAEESGLIKSALQSSIVNAPPMLITFIVVFSGIMGNIAGSAIFVIIPPLGALVFKAVGKHPIAGLAAGFGGVAAGLSANLIITPTDMLLAGITESAAQIMDPGFTVNPAVNWYFMAASAVILSIIGTIVNEKIVEPKLGKYDPSMAEENSEADLELMTVTNDQKKGMRYAGIAGLIYIVLLLMTIVPSNGILRGEGGTIVPSPFIDAIAPIFTFLFAVLGIAYGIGAGTIKKSNDIIKFLTKSVSGLAGFIVLCFFAAQFVEAFSYTNLGLLLSVKGANFLDASGLNGVALIVFFIIICACINLFIGSASAKWALISPIFVPMFMRLKLSPFFTQAAYRIADSITNSVSPLEPFMPFIIATAQKYDKKAGLGTVISTMLPIAIGYLISWTLLLIVWYLLDLPLGPGAGIFMQ